MGLIVFPAGVTASNSEKPSSAPPPAMISFPRVERPPTLEDFLDMAPVSPVARSMTKAEGFTQSDPKDGEPATQRTEVYFGYDDKNLYCVWVAFDTESAKIRARMSRREETWDDDFVEITLDTFRDQRRGYVFRSNPLGIQSEALFTEGQGQDFSFDTLWHTRGQRTSRGYVVWMSIPFKSLRFSSADVQTWGITLLRRVPHNNEWTWWPRVSSKISGRLNQAGTVNGLEKISPGRNMQFIPYGSYRAFRALDTRDENAPQFAGRRAEVDGGLDAKFVLRDSLVLDVTLNPDFSQVESNQPQVTANRRFEVFFPEKRPFFLENSNYFRTNMNLLFTRRIADPQFGVRLTGKLGKYALGALFADDQSPGRQVPDTDPLAGKRAYFGVLCVSRDIFKQSSLGLIYVGREFQQSYNRVGGADARLKWGKNWSSGLQAVTSSTRETDGTYTAGPAYETWIGRFGRQFGFEVEYSDVSPGFRTEAGFSPRTDYREIGQFVRYRFRPEKKFLISWGPSVWMGRLWDHSGTRLDANVNPSLEFELGGQSYLEVFHSSGRERLRPVDFSTLTADQDFSRHRTGFFFETSYFKQFTFGGSYRWGAAINFVPPPGQPPVLANATDANLFTTLRPITSLRIDNNYIFSRLTDRAGGASIFNNHILRQSWNWQFNRELSLRVILQYDALLANPALTELETSKNFNADFLITYYLHPGTALYVGYNSNLQNQDLVPCPPGSGCRTQLVRTNRFANDARGFFVKFSYLFRF